MASKTIVPVIRRAQLGDADCQFQIGCVYLDGGEGLCANERTAYMWLARAADQGHTGAWRMIGERISPRAAEGDPQLTGWYERAVAVGSITARRKLAQTLMTRCAKWSGGPDWSKALTLLEDAAHANDAEACRDLGKLLLASPQDSDYVRGCKLLEQAYQHGFAEAARDLADHHWDRRQPELARIWYERCAEPKDPALCYRLGLLNILFGQHGTRLLERAADAGHLKACEELGLRLAAGSAGHRRNLKKAARLLELPANSGSPRAAYMLSAIYRHPAFGARDGRRARAWLFRAARFGHGEACLHASETIMRAINTGMPLGTDELDSDSPDLVATKFLVTAARQGLQDAHRHLERLVRPISRPFLTDAGGWSTMISAAERKDPEIGARLKLGRALGLTARELLAVDPSACDHGDCFIVDITGGRKLRRRIVLIETEEQRRLIDEAKALLRQLTHVNDNDMVPGKSNYRSRYLKLRLISRHTADPHIDAALFPRSRLSAQGQAAQTSTQR